jgi:hypothetical protein
MKELTTKLTGIIAGVETKQTKKNTDWHTIAVEVGDKLYTVKAFGKSAIEFTESHAWQGDRVEFHCAVESGEWNGKWFLNLNMISVRIIKARTMQVPDGDDNEQVPPADEPLNPPVDDVEDLPF